MAKHDHAVRRSHNASARDEFSNKTNSRIGPQLDAEPLPLQSVCLSAIPAFWWHQRLKLYADDHKALKNPEPKPSPCTANYVQVREMHSDATGQYAACNERI
jgi:hypothetical protein